MKLKTKADLHSKTIEELNNILETCLKQAALLKVNLGREKNLRQYKFKRQEIAVIKTILNNKKMEVHE